MIIYDLYELSNWVIHVAVVNYVYRWTRVVQCNCSCVSDEGGGIGVKSRWPVPLFTYPKFPNPVTVILLDQMFDFKEESYSFTAYGIVIPAYKLISYYGIALLLYSSKPCTGFSNPETEDLITYYRTLSATPSTVLHTTYYEAMHPQKDLV